MQFGLKNVGATYQWTVNKINSDQLGRNIEVYVDHMIGPGGSSIPPNWYLRHAKAIPYDVKPQEVRFRGQRERVPQIFSSLKGYQGQP